MRRLFAVLILVGSILMFSACGGRKQVVDILDRSEPLAIEQIGESKRDFLSGLNEYMRFKKISPAMEVELDDLMGKGCVPNYQILEKDTAYMYSLIPGGGQIYTGESKKALMYMVGSFLIIPYLVAFDDAQSSVDYINAKYAIDYCREKVRLVKQKELQAKENHFLGETKPETNARKKNREFMEQLMREHKLKSKP